MPRDLKPIGGVGPATPFTPDLAQDHPLPATVVTPPAEDHIGSWADAIASRDAPAAPITADPAQHVCEGRCVLQVTPICPGCGSPNVRYHGNAARARVWFARFLERRANKARPAVKPWEPCPSGPHECELRAGHAGQCYITPSYLQGA